MSNDHLPDPPKNQAGQAADVLEPIRTALAGMRYGSVSIVVQDGVVLQIERTEKLRLR